jgi:hypothetical protein
MHGEEKRRIPVWLGKPKGKKTLGRPKRRRDDNIKLDHQ